MPEAHAARGENGKGEVAIVDFDKVDAVAEAAAEGPLVDGPIMGSGQAEIVVCGGERIEPDVVVDVGEGPGFEAGHNFIYFGLVLRPLSARQKKSKIMMKIKSRKTINSKMKIKIEIRVGTSVNPAFNLAPILLANRNVHCGLSLGCLIQLGVSYF